MFDDFGTMPAGRAGAIVLASLACLGSSSLFVLAYAPAFFAAADDYKLSLVCFGIGGALVCMNTLAFMATDDGAIRSAAKTVEGRVLAVWQLASLYAVLAIAAVAAAGFVWFPGRLKLGIWLLIVPMLTGPFIEGRRRRVGAWWRRCARRRRASARAGISS